MNKSISTRRQFLKQITFGTAASLFLNRTFGATHNESRPNFVLIMGDDISIDDFGCYGHPHIRTPNVDKLAASGMRFTNAYLTTSQCSPTRCSVITGRYPHNTGAPELHMHLPQGQPLFPLVLKDAGYYTASVGKWHLGSYPKRAFSFRAGGKGPGGQTNWISALQKRPKDKPFFFWFSSYDAHRRWSTDEHATPHKQSDAVIPPYMADMPGTRKDLAQYYDEVHRLDRYVGKIVEELQQQNVLENTIIIFMADNGRPFPRCKTWLYDSGIKTPFIVQWPKAINKAPAVCNSLISAIDIAPTILELAGLQPPCAIQGISFAPLLKDPAKQIRQYAFAEHNWHDQAAHERMVRWKNYVYIRNAHPELDNLVAAQFIDLSYKDMFTLREQGKLTTAQADIFAAPRPPEALFDTDTDYHQTKNLVNDPTHKETLEHMRSILDKWQNTTGDTVPEELTPDRFDRKTAKKKSKGLIPPKRGTIPGSEKNAQQINNPGPR